MPLPSIPATTPTIVKPAATETIYDSWWLQRFQIISDDPTNVRVTATLLKYYVGDDGLPVFSPVDGPATVFVDNVLQKSDPQSPDFDPLIAQIASVLLTNLTQYGQKNQLI